MRDAAKPDRSAIGRARALALAILVAISLAALPACSDDAPSPQAPAQESQEAVAAAPEGAADEEGPQAGEEDPAPEELNLNLNLPRIH